MTVRTQLDVVSKPCSTTTVSGKALAAGISNALNRRVLKMTLVMTAMLLTSTADSLAQSNGSKKIQYAIAIHGGAGKAPTAKEAIAQREKTLRAATEKGIAMLKAGDTSLDVVEAVIRMLEDEPVFNAGKGAVMNAVGKHELDASIMDGRTRAAGAVGGVRTVKNPISLARLVMTETRHVLLVTDGAETFADQFKQIQRVPNSYFTTDRQRKNLERAKVKVKKAAALDPEFRIGTVGCVALDSKGNIAAATSTGGLTNKKFGRVGDSPIVGAGTFADNATCGVSCTGIGEDFIRGSVAFDVSARMAYGNKTVTQSVNDILHNNKHEVRGGIIAVSHDGTIVLDFNTAGMSRAAADSTGRLDVSVID